VSELAILATRHEGGPRSRQEIWWYRAESGRAEYEIVIVRARSVTIYANPVRNFFQGGRRGPTSYFSMVHLIRSMRDKPETDDRLRMVGRDLLTHEEAMAAAQQYVRSQQEV
jgi:hypothetical protein